jgi:mRNA interferase RelE/StbE
LAYSVVLDTRIFEEDFRNIDHPQQQRILRTIRKKLATHPAAYGKPLTADLKGFWKLKVGEFRVVYQIIETKVEVSVISIGYRRNEEACLAAAKRLKLI